MVMEASPSPQSVGREFVRQYYTLLNKAPAHLHRFYNNLSSFVHGGLDAPNRETLPVIGQKQIHNRIQQLNFRDCHAKITQVDSQATLGNGVVVQVTGELSNGGAPMRRFTQTFVLAAQSPKKYYVHNDIFRYQDLVFSDEEGSDNRSEPDDYYVQPPNGHVPVVADTVVPQPQIALDPEPEPEPEVAPEPEPEPPVYEPEPAPAPLEIAAPLPAPDPEPKTYANLLKAAQPGAAPRVSAVPAAALIPGQPERRAGPEQAGPPPQGSPPAAPRRYSDSQQLFLGNLPHGATESELRALFGQFGHIAELRVHSKPGGAAGGARHPNYGFITYEQSAAAHQCLQAAPLFFPPDAPDAVKLNVEEKKARARGPRVPPPVHRHPRPPFYRR